jgi:hypothetical protein
MLSVERDCFIGFVYRAIVRQPMQDKSMYYIELLHDIVNEVLFPDWFKAPFCRPGAGINGA